MRKIWKLLTTSIISTMGVLPMATSLTSCSKMFHYVEQIAPYLHQIEYDDYREDVNYETIEEAEAFGCSSVRNGNFYGRNFDYVYNDTPEFIVRVKANAKTGRHESIAVATHFGLREQKLLDGKYNKQLELIPNLTMDGINDAGVICSSNVVSLEPNGETGVQIPETHPNNKNAKDLHVLFIVRYVLDHASSAKNAVDLLCDENLNIMGNLKKEMNLHCMIADKDETYVVEFFRKKGSTHNHFDVVWEKKENKTQIDQIMTNYYCNVNENTANFINYEKFGDERYHILQSGYATANTFDGMFSLMQDVKFSIAYSKTGHTPIPGIIEGGVWSTTEWYSEKIRQDLLALYDKSKSQDEQEGALGEAIKALEATKDAYPEKKREDANPAFWITTHNSTYDISEKLLQVVVQEDYQHKYIFRLGEDWK